eukprot:scaffold167762_cov29-Prasinocladus_malaysianus.AAC.1
MQSSPVMISPRLGTPESGTMLTWGAGWGMPAVLSATHAELVPSCYCTELFAGDNFARDDLLCAEPANPSLVLCDGDGGGPVVEPGGRPGGDRLVGLLSFRPSGQPCGVSGLRVAVTDLYSHRSDFLNYFEWVNSLMNDNL